MSTVQSSGAPGSNTGRASGGITMPGATLAGSGRRDRAGRSGSARGTGGTGGAGESGPSGQHGTGGAGGGLGSLGPLLRFAGVVAIALYLWRLTPTFGEHLMEWMSYCDSTGQDLSCLTAEPIWRYLLWPLVSVFAAIGLLRGAGVEAARRPNHSVILALAALGALATSLIWGLS